MVLLQAGEQKQTCSTPQPTSQYVQNATSSIRNIFRSVQSDLERIGKVYSSRLFS